MFKEGENDGLASVLVGSERLKEKQYERKPEECVNVRYDGPGRGGGDSKGHKQVYRKLAPERERRADEDGGGPGWGGWSLIKMFFN